MKKQKRTGFAILSALILPPAALVATAAFYVRDIPYRLPDANRYPVLSGPAALRLRYGGIAGYEVSDGETVVLVDPTVTRPTMLEILSSPINPDTALAARIFPRGDLILVKHAHYDHVADVPSIALRTGAIVAGTRSTVNLALSRGVPKDRTRVVGPGDSFVHGGFRVTVSSFRHTSILGLTQPMTGIIPADAGRLMFWQYLQDGCLSFRLESRGASIWFAGPSTFESGAPRPAGTLVMGVGGHKYDRERLRKLFSAAGAKRVFPAHYDNFFQPLSKGMSLLPILDLEGFLRKASEAVPEVPVYLLDHGEEIALPADAVSGNFPAPS